MNRRRHLVIAGIMAAALLLLAPSCAGLLSVTLEVESPGWIDPSGDLQVTCTASSSDGGDLSYEWSATGGSIDGTGAVVNWIAPEEVGMYDVTVAVTDSQDRQDTASAIVIASNGPPPVIEDLIVTADHKYLKESPVGYKVAKAYNYSIECVAYSNTSGNLTYEWSCTGGQMSGEGCVINWTAPDTVCTVTVRAKVFDALSNWVSEIVILEVVPCSECTFG